jgi:hypothetical protein
MNKRRRYTLKRKALVNAAKLENNLSHALPSDDVLPRETRLRTATSQMNKAATMHASNGSDYRQTRHERAPEDWRKTYGRFSNK